MGPYRIQYIIFPEVAERLDYTSAKKEKKLTIGERWIPDQRNIKQKISQTERRYFRE